MSDGRLARGGARLLASFILFYFVLALFGFVLFLQGWRSVYVNEPGEVLAWCTHQPTSLTWRIKQVLRWHQGAVQLLLFKGISYTSFGGHFPTMWHRLYAFDQATYYLQAIPGYVLLIMPIVYGVTGTPPFVTR